MAKYYLLPKKLVDRHPRLQTPGWLFEAGLFYAMLGLARLMPFPMARATFSRIVGFVGYHTGNKRRVVMRNLQVVMPEASGDERAEVARRIFRSAGSAAAELFLLERLWQRRARYLEFDLHPEARVAIDRKEPIIFASAHVGGWQLGPLLCREYGFPASVLYAPERNPWLDRFFIGRRRAFGAKLVPSTGGARDFMRELSAGRTVGAAFDTRVDQGEKVPFFGIPTETTTMPALLALRGYKLMPIRTTRLPGCRYRIELMAPIAPRDMAAPRKAQVLDLTAQLNDLFEAWIREDPGQWICMKRRWPKATRRSAADD